MYDMMSGVGRRRAEPRARTPYISQTVQLEDQSAPQGLPFRIPKLRTLHTYSTLHVRLSAASLRLFDLHRR